MKDETLEAEQKLRDAVERLGYELVGLNIEEWGDEYATEIELRVELGDGDSGSSRFRVK